MAKRDKIDPSPIDTLDYSGTGLNQGSKVVIAASGDPQFELLTQIPAEFTLPDGFTDPAIVFPGVLAVTAPRFDSADRRSDLAHLSDWLSRDTRLHEFRLITLVDDSPFVSRSLGALASAI